MKRKRKLRGPHFVKVRLLADGTIEATDNDGAIFSISMHKEEAYPIVGRRVRQFEIRETREKVRTFARKLASPPPSTPTSPFKPKLVS